MKSAIVTGATGFIGSHLCHELSSNGVSVTALLRNENRDRLPYDANSIRCGMDDYPLLNAVSADIFYHLAWEGATGEGRNDAALQIKNAARTAEALHAAKRLGCKRFIALGTVYEKLVPQIISCSTHRKADFYLLSKEYAHNMCAKLAAELGIELIWVMIFQPIGKYIKPEQVMYYTIKGLLGGTSPSFGPAMEPYDITAVENVAYGLRLLGANKLSHTEYYIGSGAPKKLKEYLEEARAILGTSTAIGIGARPDDGLRFSFGWYDISALAADTGYSPAISYETAILNTAEWIKSTDKG